MKTYNVNHLGKEITIEVLNIEEAKRRHWISKEDAVGYYTYYKDGTPPQDKYFVRAKNVLPNQPKDWVSIGTLFRHNPTKEEVINSVKNFVLND